MWKAGLKTYIMGMGFVWLWSGLLFLLAPTWEWTNWCLGTIGTDDIVLSRSLISWEGKPHLRFQNCFKISGFLFSSFSWTSREVWSACWASFYPIQISLFQMLELCYRMDYIHVLSETPFFSLRSPFCILSVCLFELTNILPSFSF